MGMGSPNVYIQEYDLSEVVSTFNGVIGAIIIDSERGKVNDKMLITNEKQLIDNYGKPLPKKYGLGIYSAINFLKESNKLYVVRVDKGQTYSSLLVRSKINPISEFDEYGYILENPVIDPIVQPLGSLTAEQIEGFQFSQYPTTREVSSFLPPIALLDKPYEGDNVFNIDNTAPIEIGDSVTFKDTTDMSREESMIYQTYTVIQKDTVLTPYDFIKIDGAINAVAYDSEIKAVRHYYLNTSPITYADKLAVSTDSLIYSKTLHNSIVVNSKLKFGVDGSNELTVSSITPVIFTENFNTDININGVDGSPVITTTDDLAPITVGLRVSIDAQSYIVSEFNPTASPKTILLNNPIVSKWHVTNIIDSSNEGASVAQKITLYPDVISNVKYTITINGNDYTITSENNATRTAIINAIVTAMSGDADVTATINTNNLVIEAKVAGVPFTYSFKSIAGLKQIVDYKSISFTSQIGVDIPKGTNVKLKSTQVTNYIPIVKAKELIPGTTDTIRISNNDPIAEEDWIEINNTQYKVLSKWQTHNYVNTITVDKLYADQISATIGNEVYKVVKGDFEHHDAFMVYANTPGEWGNKLAIAVRDSKNYEEAFWIDVYFDGILVEEWEVARKQSRDGYGRQLFLEDKVNQQSSYIRVKNNEFMTDENGEPVEPLKTLYYIRQPSKIPNYNKNATIVESVWDGDNRIRINTEEVVNIDVTKPVEINGTTYKIATIAPSIAEGALDTIVLQTPVYLGMDYLPPMDRYIPINSPLKQYFNRAKIYELSLVAANAEIYEIIIKGTTYTNYSKKYSYTVQNNSTISSILQGIAGVINADTTSRVTANVVGIKLLLHAKVAGVDFTINISSNITAIIKQENARIYTNYNLERINGSILPKVSLNATIELLGNSYVIRDAGANKATGGNDAGYPTIGQYLIALDSVFQDAEQCDFLVFLDSGVTAKAYQQRIVEICEKRQDCFALLSMDFDAQANPDIVLGVLKYRSELMINSSYGAIYTPWTKIYDKYNDFEIWISPESWASRAISYISTNRELWYAPAGWDHGRVIALDVFRRYTLGERDILYDNQINTIRFAPNKGLVIWGQKTLQTKPSALDRINVRFLLIVIERGARDYLEYQVFKFNDDFTRNKMRSDLNIFLQDIKTRRGLYDYNVVCDETNNTPAIIDRNQMYVDIYLQPIKTAEFITARIVITRTGANFNEIRI